MIYEQERIIALEYQAKNYKNQLEIEIADNRNLRHNIEDLKAKNEALKVRIKELEKEVDDCKLHSGYVAWYEISTENDKLKAKTPNWIALKDRQPEKSMDDVLFITYNGQVKQGWCYKQCGYWHFCFIDKDYNKVTRDYLENEVTHWMDSKQLLIKD